MMFSLSGFLNAHGAHILLLLGRLPLNHCSGKHCRKLLEKGNSTQAVFTSYTATFEAVNNFPQLEMVEFGPPEGLWT